jgi:hypothetical protein
MIGQILSNNNEKYYRNFTQTFSPSKQPPTHPHPHLCAVEKKRLAASLMTDEGDKWGSPSSRHTSKDS